MHNTDDQLQMSVSGGAAAFYTVGDKTVNEITARQT